MNQGKVINYNIEVIINRLENGQSFDTLEKFYNVRKETIIEDIRKYYNLNTYDDIRTCLLQSKKGFKKPTDNTAITYAKYYKKIGYSYEQFLKLMEESKRPFSQKAKLLAKKVFENDEDIEKNNNSNDEIEM